MHRAWLGYDKPGWAYHRRCMGLLKHAPNDFHVATGEGRKPNLPTEPYDIYLQLCYFHAPHLRQHLADLGHDGIIVTGCNTGWINEGPREGRFHFETFKGASDHVIFNNRAAWHLAGTIPNSTWISNGVDQDAFRVKIPLHQRKPKVIWVGSFFHTEPNRDLKNYRSIMLPLKERLEKRGIECDLRRVDSTKGRHQGEPGVHFYSTEEMVDWYNSATIYVCASNSEGTPNPALEAASCGCTILSPPVGNMPELIKHGVNGLFVERSIEAIEKAVDIATENYLSLATEMLKSIQVWDWQFVAKSYYALFRRLIHERRQIHAA